MKEQAIQKINKIGKISSVFALIAKIVVGMGLVCTIIGAIICFAIPKELVDVTTAGAMVIDLDFTALGAELTELHDEAAREEAVAEMKESFESEDDEFTVVDVTMDETGAQIVGTMAEYSFSIRDGAWAVVIAALALAMTFVTLCFISALCKAFRDCQSPFEENVIKKMRNLAVALIPWCIVSSVSDSTFNSIVNGKPSFSLSVDLGMVLIILVVLVMVYIFK
ncbi:MAG: hypothetical protein IJ409_01940, partial [Lachnospiraceae bacterium]|nr:hypothetical protein [Lachnospiraceae bacterium]